MPAAHEAIALPRAHCPNMQSLMPAVAVQKAPNMLGHGHEQC